MNQVFGVAAACLLCFSNASVIADKVVFLSINLFLNRIEPVIDPLLDPAQAGYRWGADEHVLHETAKAQALGQKHHPRPTKH